MLTAGLTSDEEKELGDRIAMGQISRSCPRIKVDWVNLTLSTGKKVIGKYKWDDEGWLSFEVRKA